MVAVCEQQQINLTFRCKKEHEIFNFGLSKVMQTNFLHSFLTDLEFEHSPCFLK